MSSQWRGLEPSGLGHELLLEWAPWAKDDQEGRQSWNIKPKVDHGYHGDWPEKIMLVDRIIARIKVEHHPYWRVIAHYYLGGLQPWQMTEKIRATEGWVRSMLLAACGLVEIRYKERLEFGSSHAAQPCPYVSLGPVED